MDETEQAVCFGRVCPYSIYLFVICKTWIYLVLNTRKKKWLTLWSFVVNEWPCYHFIIKSNQAKDQIVGLFKICSPYMVYIHATTYSSWVSQKENKNIGRSVISLLQKNSYFYSYTHEEILINGYTLELYFLDNL